MFRNKQKNRQDLYVENSKMWFEENFQVHRK